MEELNIQQIHKYRTYIDFMLSQQQWSGITKADTERWLKNFRDLQPGEMLLVYKLLVNIIYFSENDVIDALREGISNCLFSNIFLDKQKAAFFSLSPQALSNIERDELRKTCFTPLLDSESPHESGNYITRLMVQQQLINARQSLFLQDVVTPICSGEFHRVVIIDDCVGSGDQLRDFWKDSAMITYDNQEIHVSEFCNKFDVEVYYLALFAYDKSIENLRNEFPELKVVCVRMLSDNHRVFEKCSYIWECEDELELALELFSEITKENDIPLYGHGKLDFAFIMHRTIPDWSLPMFWKQNNNWKFLLRRKNSSD